MLYRIQILDERSKPEMDHLKHLPCHAMLGVRDLYTEYDEIIEKRRLYYVLIKKKKYTQIF